MRPRRQRPRWNHNIHYYPLILRAVPAGAARALDVGCGEGTLTRRLAAFVPNVTGIDPHGPSLELARDAASPGQVSYIQADFLCYDFEPGSFDFIASVAALHHMDEPAALRRMRELLRPGGTLAIVGLARSDLPADLPVEIAAAIANPLYRLRFGLWETPSPKVWPPPRGYREVRELARRELPAVTYRRLLLWRYWLTWTRPL